MDGGGGIERIERERERESTPAPEAAALVEFATVEALSPRANQRMWKL